MAKVQDLRLQSSVPATPSSGVCSIYIDSNANINRLDSSGKSYTIGGNIINKLIPQNILASTLTIPALTSGVVTNVLVPLSGNLINPNGVLVGFLDSSIPASFITGFRIHPHMGNSGIAINDQLSVASNDSNSPFFMSDRFLYITTDYTKARRFITNYNTINKEHYGYPPTVQNTNGFVYSDIPSNVLIGYYGLSSTNGVLGTNSRVQLNSAWLDGTGNAVFSFTNWDADNAVKNIRVAFYE